MSDKEILSIRVMGRDISIACPPEDKPLLLEASTILNKEIEQIPDKGNALILAALNLAFQSLKGTQVSDDDSNKINQIISSIDDALNESCLKKILHAEVNFKMYNLNTGSFANTFDIFEPILK